MKITVLAKPGKKETKIVQTGINQFTISVKEKAEKGKANYAIISVLAEYLQVPQSEIRFVSGQTAKVKIFEVSATARPKKQYFEQTKLHFEDCPRSG